jgi:hypothetical protein
MISRNVMEADQKEPVMALHTDIRRTVKTWKVLFKSLGEIKKLKNLSLWKAPAIQLSD